MPLYLLPRAGLTRAWECALGFCAKLGGGSSHQTAQNAAQNDGENQKLFKKIIFYLPNRVSRSEIPMLPFTRVKHENIIS